MRAATGEDAPPPDLFGRAAECAAIDTALANARKRLSTATVLRGDAGMGKTALLHYAERSASGFRVLRVNGLESESGFGFAGLHGLVAPFLGKLDSLPPGQRAALGSAFGLSVAAPSDRFLIGLGALTLLADAASEQPLLCVIDDAQWLDRESLDAVTFVARRIQADAIVLLFSTRSSAGTGRLFEGLRMLDVDALDTGSAHELLSSLVPGKLDSDVARRIVSDSAGCALAIEEIAGMLSPEQLAGGALLPDPLPLGNRLEGYYRSQIGRLSEAAQAVLLAAAVEPAANAALVRQAAALLDLPDAASDEAEASGLLAISPQVRFRHPLIRSAVCDGVPAVMRRAVHRAFTQIIDRHFEPDRWLWHMAAAAEGPDDELASELERRGDRSGSRGRYAERAELLTRSAELTPQPDSRAQRELAAAQAHQLSGSPKQAERLLSLAEPVLQDPLLRAQAMRLRAALRSFTNPGAIPAILLAAARELEPLNVRLARDTYADALEACLVSCQLTKDTTPLRVAEAALAAPPAEDGKTTTADLMLNGFATRIAGGYRQAKDSLQNAVKALLAHGDGTSPFAHSSVLGINAAAELWDADSYEAILRGLEPVERARGALDSLRLTLGGLGHCEMWAGRFGQADAYHSEATDISRALGEDPAGWEVLKIELLAWQGADETTRAMAEIALGPFVEALGAGIVANLACVALTILNIGQNRYEEALQYACQVWETDSPPQASQVLPDVVEAGVRTGQREVAARGLAHLRERAQASGTLWALGLLARSEAVLAEQQPESERHYEQALAHLSATRVMTDRARTHLLYGEWLRRENRRMDARNQLRTAYEMFVDMGAGAFAERSRRELAATGERARQRTVDTAADLTPQERQVAVMAAAGQTNREIAAHIYISPNTVDYHLRKVFRKLSVSSRRDLRNALG